MNSLFTELDVVAVRYDVTFDIFMKKHHVNILEMLKSASMSIWVNNRQKAVVGGVR
jgi:hypothetical protein